MIWQHVPIWQRVPAWCIAFALLLLLRQRIRLLRCRTCVLPPVRWVIHLWNPALGTTFIVRTARSQNLGHPHLHLRQKRPDIVSGRMGVLTHICAAAVALVSPMQFSLLPTLSSSAVLEIVKFRLQCSYFSKTALRCQFLNLKTAVQLNNRRVRQKEKHQTAVCVPISRSNLFNK